MMDEGLIVEMAAFAGSFDPERLLETFGNANGFDGLSMRLGEMCEESLAFGYRWRMRDDERRAILARITERPQLDTIVKSLEDASCRPAADASTLIVFLKSPAATWAGSAQDGHDALQLADLIPALRAEDRSFATVRTRLNRQLDSEAALRAGRFVRTGRTPLTGRDAELKALMTFAKSNSQKDIMVLHGDAGVGKSAMIAALLEALNDKSHNILPLVLDFDDPSLQGGNIVEALRALIGELIRAIRADPSKVGDPSRLIESLQQLFKRQRSRRLDEATQRLVPLSARARRTEASASAAELAELVILLQPLHVLLIFDSFETVLDSNDADIADLLDLGQSINVGKLPSIRTLVGLRHDREQVCGRLEDANAKSLIARFDWRKLGPLSPEAAAALLAHLDDETPVFASESQRQTAARIAGNFPLTLKLLHRHFAVEKRDGASIEGELNDLGAHQALKGKLHMEVIQFRILSRIRDHEVRVLARAALLVREITPVILKSVLAVPCGLGDIGDEAAHRILDKLRRHWLADGGSDGGIVRPRADLRRNLAQSILAGEPELAPRINRALAAHFMAIHRKANGGNVTALAEALYHRGLAGEAPPLDFKDGDGHQIATRIGLDIEILPLPWRAFLRAIDERSALSQTDVDALADGPLRQHAGLRFARQLQEQGNAPARVLDQIVAERQRDDASRQQTKSRQTRSLNSEWLRQEILSRWDHGDLGQAALAFDRLLGQTTESKSDRPAHGLLSLMRRTEPGPADAVWLGVLAKSVVSPWEIRSVPTQKEIGELHLDYALAVALLAQPSFWQVPWPRTRLGLDLARLSGARSPRRSILGARQLGLLLARGAYPKSGTSSLAVAKTDMSLDSLAAEADGFKFTPQQFTATALANWRREGKASWASMLEVYSASDRLTLSIDWPLSEDARAKLLRALNGPVQELHQPLANKLIAVKRGMVFDLVDYLWEKDKRLPLNFTKSYRKGNPIREQDLAGLIDVADRLGHLDDVFNWFKPDGSLAQLRKVRQTIGERIFGLRLPPSG